MRFSIRNLVLASTAMAAFATTAAFAATVNVPFGFTVNGKNCPAGVYSLERNNLDTFVTLKSRSSAQSFSWSIAPGNPNPNDTNVIMQFDALGQNYALHSVQYGPRTTANLNRNNRSIESLPTRAIQGY